MRVTSGRPIHQISVHVDGPWPCEQCKQLTQFAECKNDINRIFCVNDRCRFMRIIDKRRCIIQEADGSLWRYNTRDGSKVRIRG